MKTTIEIADNLLLAAKRRAARDGTTLRALVEDGLRAVLQGPSRDGFRLRDASIGGNGLSPEFRDASWERVREVIYASTHLRPAFDRR